MAKEIGRNRAVLHQNHGLLTTSRHSIDDAAFWFIALERACQQQLMVEATGIKPQLLSDKTAQYSQDNVGNDFIGWLHFQTSTVTLRPRSPTCSSNERRFLNRAMAGPDPAVTRFRQSSRYMPAG